jgi:hypothetical protein
MNSRPLLLVVALFAAVVGVDAVRRHRRPAEPAPTTASVATTTSGNGGQPVPGRQLGPLPGINAPSAGTPTLDLMARLAIRRRLEREGNRVYLDSLLANTDSVLVRWADRGDSPLTIAFVRDTTIPGWSDALFDDVRSALQNWDGNAAGLRFREAAATDSADIKVRWVASMPDSARVGVTNLSWSPEGEVHGADITLALQESVKHTALPVSVRRRVAAHELGHAIGLPHSGDRDDLMFPGTLASSPSRRDQATLQLLYAVPPGSIRVPQ